MTQKNSYYVTTPIYYVSSVPHIGHAYTTIAADVLARWNKLCGKDVYFLVGTDEHGQKISEAAQKRNVKPKEWVDSLVPIFKQSWEKLTINYNRFIRTTDDDHKKEVQHFTTLVNKNDDIYKGEYEGWYCVSDERFWTEVQLDDGKCPECGKAVRLLKEDSYFFKLSKYQDKLLKLYDEHPEFISPPHRRQEIIHRVKEGLKDLSVSRKHIAWGIPFAPDNTHTTYVWFDALTNYLTGIGYPKHPEHFDQFWPADVHIVGKEILWFHAVIWPAMLMSAGLPLPKKVFAHGWLTVDKQKMSKSIGNVVDPVTMVDKYGADVLRFFLLKEIPFGNDGDFSERDLVERRNAELADDLGNLLMRVLTLIQKYNDGTIPPCGNLHAPENELIEGSALYEEVSIHLEKLEFHLALERIWKFVKAVNKYFQDQKPWSLEDESRRNTVLYVALESLRLCANFLKPFIPTSAEHILAQLGQTKPDLTFSHDTTGTVQEPVAVFEKAPYVEHPFSRALLKVGKIENVEQHPHADKLYVLRVDIGNEHRQIVAGLKDWYTPEMLQDRIVVVAANLKHATLRGVESQGMLLAAEKEHDVVLLNPKQATPGEVVFIKGVLHRPGTIKIDHLMNLKLHVTDGRVYCKNEPLQTPAGDVCADVGNGAVVR